MKIIPSFPDIKKIIGGVAYNTSTSTCLETHSAMTELLSKQASEAAPMHAFEQLYRTKFGHMFFVYRQKRTWIPSIRDFRLHDEVVPTTLEEAKKWLNTNFPNSSASFTENLAGLLNDTQKKNVPVTTTLRIDCQFKEQLLTRSRMTDISFNSLCTQYLKYGLENYLEQVPPAAKHYTFEEKRTTRLLTDDGQPGIGGILGNGNKEELNRSIVAASFRLNAHCIPKNLRDLLINIISMGEVEQREILLDDLKRWLEMAAPENKPMPWEN